jgi:predicted SAM-dependent methyltransferase
VVRLELGSGERPFGIEEGWLHNDVRPLPHIEYVGLAEEPWSWLTDHTFVDELRATHLLEHYSWRDTVPVLMRWYEILKPDGMLYLEVPNFKWQVTEGWAQMEREGQTDDWLVDLVYGSQDYEGNFHRAGFTPRNLADRLGMAGFYDVEILDIGMVLCARASKLP